VARRSSVDAADCIFALRRSAIAVLESSVDQTTRGAPSLQTICCRTIDLVSMPADAFKLRYWLAGSKDAQCVKRRT
jgi:hypothetical protein